MNEAKSQAQEKGKHHAQLTGGDLALLAGFHQTRQILYRGTWQDAEKRLGELEEQVGRKLVSLRKRSEAVADANVRSVEIIQGQMELNDQLRSQNEQLMEQQKQLRGLLRDLNWVVEAAEAVPEQRSNVHDAVSARTDTLMKQAVALAEANVRAVTMLDEREKDLLALKERARKLESASHNLEEQAFNDVLTGLFNHRYFSQQIKHEIARAHRYERSMSVAFVDLDNFKPINDQHGHQAGDRVLRWMGELIRHTLRTADITYSLKDGEPVLARYGGDEFVIILPETDLEGAEIAMIRVCRIIADTPVPLEDAGETTHLTVSVGVACLSEGESAEELVGRADRAVYNAKKGGRNRVCVSEPS